MRNTQFPRKDFFTQSIRFRDIKGPLLKLQKLFKAKENTDIPRQTLEHARDQQIEAIIEKVIQTMISVRAVAKNQFHESTNALPTYQKIWLMDTKDDQSHKDEAWLDEVCKNICQWIKAAYQKTNSRAMTLGPAEYDYILSYVNKYREALR